MLSGIRTRLSGKWQIPLLLVAFALMTYAIVTIPAKPVPPPPSPDEAIIKVQQLADGGLHRRAIREGNAALARPELTDEQRAFVHLQVARARYADATQQDRFTVDAGRRVVEDYRQALAVPDNLEGEDFVRMGRALEWQRESVAAIDRYDEALRRGVSDSAELRRHVLALREHQANDDPTRVVNLLKDFLAELGPERPDIRLWAIERRLALLLDLNRAPEAEEMINSERAAFDGSDLSLRFGIAEASLWVEMGRSDEAETRLRALQSAATPADETYARVGWLLGRVVLSDGGPQRPEEAISFFRDARQRSPGGPYTLACQLGEAEALAMLRRYELALEGYRDVLRGLASGKPAPGVNPQVLRVSLGVRAEAERQAGQLVPALEYARLANEAASGASSAELADLLHLLAQVQTQVGEHLLAQADAAKPDDPSLADTLSDDARAMFADAAGSFNRLSEVTASQPRRSAEAAWLSAELFVRARRLEDAAEGFRRFVADFPSDALIARGLLRQGQVYQQLGRPRDAIAAYQECYKRFPRSLDGMNAIVPLAESYLALGPGYERQAEQTLRIVLEESELFTPEAPAFADAMFLLGEALNRFGEFNRAIETLEEAIARYPDDRRTWRSLYFLADSYRRSGEQFLTEASQGPAGSGASDGLRERAADRLRRASELYRRVVNEPERRGPTNRVDEMYLRHAYLFEADCIFALHEYRRALRLYEEAAGRYPDSADALAAYVQIINCHVFLSELDEARSARARAIVLVNTLGDEAFTAPFAARSRESFREYFAWLGDTDLF